MCYKTRWWIKFFRSTSLAGVDHTQTSAGWYDKILRSKLLHAKKKSDIELVVDDQISEKVIDKKDQEDQSGDEEAFIYDEEKIINQN